MMRHIAIAAALLAPLAWGCKGDLQSEAGEPVRAGDPRSGDDTPKAPGPEGADPGVDRPDGGASDEGPPPSPVGAGLRRMTDEQYAHALDAVVTSLAPNKVEHPAFRYAFERAIETVSNSSELSDRLATTGARFGPYVRAAIISSTWLVREDAIGALANASDDDQSRANIGAWLAERGHHFFRRPMRDDEIAYYRDEVMRYPASHEHLRELFTALLLSPQFLLRVETGEGEEPEIGGGVPITPYELASRLSFFLWQGPPDDELYALAQDGSLARPEVLEAQFDRMIRDERSDRMLWRLAERWLGLHEGDLDFAAVNGSGEIREQRAGPARRAADAFLAEKEDVTQNADTVDKKILDTIEAEAEADVAAYLRYVIVREQGSLRDLFLTNAMTAPSDELAFYYGAKRAWDGEGSPPEHDTARGGILGRIAFLATTAPKTRPVIRGLRIRRNVLCQSLGDPPEDFVFTPPPDPPFSTRAVVEHTSGPGAGDGSCWACHKSMNGLGFAFEGYNIFGRARDEEVYYLTHGEERSLSEEQRAEMEARTERVEREFERITGVPYETARSMTEGGEKFQVPGFKKTLGVEIETSALPYLDRSDDQTRVGSPGELALLIADREDARACFASHLAYFGLEGAHWRPEDRASLEQTLAEKSVLEALKELVLSASFRHKEFGDRPELMEEGQ